MKFFYLFPALGALAIGLSACSEGAAVADEGEAIEVEAAAVAPAASEPAAPEPAAPDDSEQLTKDLAVIERACLATPNTNEAVCDCVVKEARALKPDELALAVAQYEGDEARAADARTKLDVMGLTNGGSFLVNAPIMCSG